MTAREIAARFGLRRARPGEWRGSCPVCGYAGGCVLNEGRDGTPLLWCASCRDGAALGAILRGEGYHHTQPAAERDRVPAPSYGQREAWARAMWGRGVPIAGTVAEAYLRSRGLGMVASDALRVLPAERHRESGRILPALVAAVVDTAGTLRGVHRTWLRADGGGKADVDPPRKTLGNPTGCAVRLMAAADAVALAEGIETALSAARLFSLPAWGCLSAGGLEAVRLPDVIRSVLIAADNDRNGSGQRAADALAQRLLAEGRAVRIALPDTPGMDFNDLLRREAHADA